MGLAECLHRELSIGSGQEQGGQQKNTSKKNRGSDNFNTLKTQRKNAPTTKTTKVSSLSKSFK